MSTALDREDKWKVKGIFAKRLVSRCEWLFRRFVGSVHRQMPASPRRCGRQTEIDCIATGIEHQAKRMLLVFLDQTGKLLFLRVKPIGQIAVAG